MLDVDCYDFKTGTWYTLAAKLPMGTGGGTAVNLKGKLFYIGGERATDTEPNSARKDVFYLDPSTQDQWTKATDLNMARNGVGGAVIGDKIYIAGGAGGGPGGPSAKWQAGYAGHSGRVALRHRVECRPALYQDKSLVHMVVILRWKSLAGNAKNLFQF